MPQQPLRTQKASTSSGQSNILVRLPDSPPSSGQGLLTADGAALIRALGLVEGRSLPRRDAILARLTRIVVVSLLSSWAKSFSRLLPAPDSIDALIIRAKNFCGNTPLDTGCPPHYSLGQGRGGGGGGGWRGLGDLRKRAAPKGQRSFVSARRLGRWKERRWAAGFKGLASGFQSFHCRSSFFFVASFLPGWTIWRCIREARMLMLTELCP